MIIEEEFGEYYYGDLVIENYPNLQSIVVKKNSLKNLNSLKICNCEKLETIETEDGEKSGEGVFTNVKNVIIEEGFGNDYYGNLLIENHPNLQSIVVKKNSLKNLNSLKICNCEKLKTIEIEDGDFKDGSFNYVRNLIIESI